MISQDLLAKYNAVVSHNKFDKAILNDIACAICTADTLFGDNDKRLDVARLAQSGVGFISFNQVNNTNPLPDVQVLRVLCDTLLLAYKFSGIIVPSGFDFAVNPKTTVVGTELGLSIHSGNDGYASEDVCISILNAYYSSISEDVLNPTIEYIIKFIHRYDKSLDCKGLSLPKKYKVLGSLNGATYTVDDIDESTFMYNLASCLVRNYSKVALARRLAISAKVDDLQYRHRKEVVLALESGTLTIAKQGNHSLYSIISKLFHFTYSKSFVKLDGILCLIYLLSLNPAISSVEFMKDLLFKNQEGC